MESSSQSKVSGGLWNNPRVTQYSKKTQDMLKIMMQESRLTIFQRKQINECLKNGEPLPLITEGKVQAGLPESKPKSVQKRLSEMPHKRSVNACRAGSSYTRDKYRPLPTRDLEKEKIRLQYIMATGKEPKPLKRVTQRAPEREPGEEDQLALTKEQHQAVVEAIEERKQFLEDMITMGQERPYIGIVNTEISQKVRELELMEKKNTKLTEKTEDQTGTEPAAESAAAEEGAEPAAAEAENPDVEEEKATETTE